MPLYADGFGYLLLAENSISELNKRLKENEVHDMEVEQTRFRPNIYVTGMCLPILPFLLYYMNFD